MTSALVYGGGDRISHYSGQEGYIESLFIHSSQHLWLTHVGLDADDLAPADTNVEHLWARVNEKTAEFELVRDYGNDTLKKAADVFPVTRVWL